MKGAEALGEHLGVILAGTRFLGALTVRPEKGLRGPRQISFTSLPKKMSSKEKTK